MKMFFDLKNFFHSKLHFTLNQVPQKLLAFGLWYFFISFFARIAFVVWNETLFQGLPVWDIFTACLHGLRFDAWWWSWCSLILWWTPVLGDRKFLLLQTSLASTLILFFIDTAYFSYTSKRLSWESLFAVQELGAQFESLVKTFWKLSLLGVSFVTILVFGFYKISLLNLTNFFSLSFSRKTKIFIYVVGFVFFVAVLRGGLQRRPLHVPHAFIFEHSTLSQVSLNNGFLLVKTLGENRLKIPREMDSQEIARAKIFEQSNNSTHSAESKAEFLNGEGLNFEDVSNSFQQSNSQLNVVVLLIESLGQEYFRPDVTPFLKNLESKSLSFSNHYANGRRSIEAVWSVFAGIPGLMDEPFVSSPYQANHHLKVSNVFSQHSSSFFHGGKNGTMFFDLFAKMSGISAYFGRTEFLNARRRSAQSEDLGQGKRAGEALLRNDAIENTWGIHDKPFLNYTCHTLSEISASQNKPFFSAIFTLSSHNPYVLPEGTSETEKTLKYNVPLPNVPIEKVKLLPVLRYADEAVQEFFECAQKQAWYENTIFVVTGDHTSENFEILEPKKQNKSLFHVPLLFFSPSTKVPVKQSKILAQHIDIVPTLQTLLFGKSNAFFLSQSLFEAPKFRRMAIQRIGFEFQGFTTQENDYWKSDFSKISQNSAEAEGLLRYSYFVKSLNANTLTESYKNQ